MTIFAKSRAAKMALRIAALAGLTAGLSACYTDFGLGYASDGYNNYDCDPYSPFDSYYGCDYGYGFSNIGYGGGWYDNFYYPGHGVFVFDNYGRRSNMRDHHRRYWGGQRFNWQREHYRGGRQQNGNQGGGYYPQPRRRDRDGYRDPQGANGQAGTGQVGGHHNGRRGNGRHEEGGRGNGGWQGRGNGAGAVGVPQAEPELRVRDDAMGRRQERGFEGGEYRRENNTPPPQQRPSRQQEAPQVYSQPQQVAQPQPERQIARPEGRERREPRRQTDGASLPEE